MNSIIPKTSAESESPPEPRTQLTRLRLNTILEMYRKNPLEFLDQTLDSLLRLGLNFVAQRLYESHLQRHQTDSVRAFLLATSARSASIRPEEFEIKHTDEFLARFFPEIGSDEQIRSKFLGRELDSYNLEQLRVVAHLDLTERWTGYDPTTHPRSSDSDFDPTRSGSRGPVVFTVTTCKRFDLFERTLNSFLACCLDKHLIGTWICVDDNSSPEDREKMRTRYPFFEFILKTPEKKGHARSMNLILDRLDHLSAPVTGTGAKFWCGIEDDWVFFERRNYLTECLTVLCDETVQKTHQIQQCLFNRNYCELPLDLEFIVGGELRWALTNSETQREVNVEVGSPTLGDQIPLDTECVLPYFLHTHEPDNGKMTARLSEWNFPNQIPNRLCPEKSSARAWDWGSSAYWPHYSLRPGLIRISALQKVGRYNESPGLFFEREYANRWFYDHHFQSAFLPGVYSKHIGRLTSEKNDPTKANAYALNETDQFGSGVQKVEKKVEKKVEEKEKKVEEKKISPVKRAQISLLDPITKTLSTQIQDRIQTRPEIQAVYLDPITQILELTCLPTSSRFEYADFLGISSESLRVVYEDLFGSSEEVKTTDSESPALPIESISASTTDPIKSTSTDPIETLLFSPRKKSLVPQSDPDDEILALPTLSENSDDSDSEEVLSVFTPGAARTRFAHLPRAFVINLDRREDRWKKLRFPEHLRIERYSAVNGRRLKPTPQLGRIFDGNDYRSEAGRVGCALSHLDLYTQLLYSTTEDSILILEDDLTFVPEFAEKLDHLLNQVPKFGWDFIYLGTHLRHKQNREDPTIQRFLSQTRYPKLFQVSTRKFFELSVGGNTAYLVSRSGALKFLDYIERKGMIQCCDTEVMKAADEMTVYLADTLLVDSDCEVYNGGIDSDIAHERTSLGQSTLQKLKEILDRYQGNDLAELDKQDKQEELALEDRIAKERADRNEGERHDREIRERKVEESAPVKTEVWEKKIEEEYVVHLSSLSLESIASLTTRTSGSSNGKAIPERVPTRRPGYYAVPDLARENGNIFTPSELELIRQSQTPYFLIDQRVVFFNPTLYRHRLRDRNGTFSVAEAKETY